ncbi:MAG: hypothetical protein HY704_12465 [Gemmatimonadetes bacterium]|nr:hypothetical protein [Gemmatimonadota bacterium]
MKALGSVVERIRHESRETAEVLCLAVDSFARGPDPQRLQLLLDVLRDGQMTCEDARNRLKGIRRRRERRYGALRSRKADVGAGMAEQERLAEERVRLVELRRSILRQLGDAVAWFLLGNNPRLIASLYAPRTRAIPRGAALAGLLRVEHALHGSGRYFVLENDLVRCGGIGDLLVTQVGRIGSEPLALELNPSGEVRLGPELGVGILPARSSVPEHRKTFEDVAAILRASESRSGGDSPRTARRARELLESVSRVFRINRSGMQTLRRPASPHWQTLQNVIDRALTSGLSFDQEQADLYRWAVRNHRGDDARRAMLDVHKRIQSIAAISAANPYATSSSLDLAANDQLSAIGLPVALWELPAYQRAAVLAQEVIVGNVRKRRPAVE